MTTIAKPELVARGARPHKGGYRLYTRDHVAFDALPEWPDGPATVTLGGLDPHGWGVSYNVPLTGEDRRIRLNIYRYEGPAEGFELHELDGTLYDTKRDATRAAFDAGVLAFMVYEDDAEKWEATR